LDALAMGAVARTAVWRLIEVEDALEMAEQTDI
jgi:hypothetical protein